MHRTARIIVASLLVLVSAASIPLVGGQFMRCLGPLGVTLVQCAKVTGSIPGLAPGVPMLVIAFTIATFTLAPPAGADRMPVALAGLAGGVLGGGAYFVLRPLTMEGLNSRGEWLSIPRPLDGVALLTAAALGVFLGAHLIRQALVIRRSRQDMRRKLGGSN